MEQSDSLKLYLIGGLSLLGFCISAMVFVTVIPADNPTGTGFRYLFVGVTLAFVFALFGGLSDVAQLGHRVRTYLNTHGDHLPPPPHALSQELSERSEAPAPTLDQARPSTDLVVPIAEETRAIGGSGAELDVSLSIPDSLVATIEHDGRFIDRYESSLIDALIDAGELSKEGPVSDHDVGVMLIAATARSELVELLASNPGQP